MFTAMAALFDIVIQGRARRTLTVVILGIVGQVKIKVKEEEVWGQNHRLQLTIVVIRRNTRGMSSLPLHNTECGVCESN